MVMGIGDGDCGAGDCSAEAVCAGAGAGQAARKGEGNAVGARDGNRAGVERLDSDAVAPMSEECGGRAGVSDRGGRQGVYASGMGAAVRGNSAGVTAGTRSMSSVGCSCMGWGAKYVDDAVYASGSAGGAAGDAKFTALGARSTPQELGKLAALGRLLSAYTSDGAADRAGTWVGSGMGLGWMQGMKEGSGGAGECTLAKAFADGVVLSVSPMAASSMSLAVDMGEGAGASGGEAGSVMGAIEAVGKRKGGAASDGEDMGPEDNAASGNDGNGGDCSRLHGKSVHW